MRIIKYLLLVLISDPTYSQQITIDTLRNAIASVNTFNPIPVYGPSASGSLYGAGINLLYGNDGTPLPVQFVRIDFGKKMTTFKTLPGVLSGNGAFWIAAFDETKNVYLSMSAPTRKILWFNLKDSIQYKDLGNAFRDGQSLAYSMSVGRDGKMYFGGTGGATYWSSFDPKTNKFENHPPIDPNNDYVLTIAGDINYVYAQTGQRNSVQLWSIRKRDEAKKLLCKISNTTRIQLDTREDGIYASFNSDTLKGLFKLVNGDTVRILKAAAAKKVVRGEVSNKTPDKVNSGFDPVKNKLFYSLNDKPFDSIAIPSLFHRVATRRIFSFPNDTLNIYYAGDYYGNYYRYNLKTNTSYLLGSTGYNVYSALALNDSIMFFGGYPSGYLMKWNRNQPWTTRKFIGGKLVEATDANANPKILGYWKSSAKPPAGFHHTEQLLTDAYNNIIGAGDVIRIGNAASIGGYNVAKDSMYGIAYNAYTGMGYGSIARWKKFIIYAMNNNTGKKPKLYFYNSLTNKMADSTDLGYDDYGKILVENDILYGIANDRVYKVNLTRKEIMEAYSYPKNSIRGAYFLSNGKAIVNTSNRIPSSILQAIPLSYHDYYEANGYVYAVSGNNIIRISGLVKK